MKKHAIFFISCGQIRCFSRKMPHERQKPLPFFILCGRNDFSAGGGAAELVEGSWRNQRRYFPSNSCRSFGGSSCCPRISSWTEAHPAAVGMSLSPVQNSELCLTARYFRPWINSWWGPGGRPSQGRKWRRRFSPASKASSVDGSLCPARKTSARLASGHKTSPFCCWALSGHLAPETALSRARRGPSSHLAPQTGFSRARRALGEHLAP